MKNTIKITNWINRLIMLPFLMVLLISIIENEFFVYGLYIAFLLGIYQLLSFLTTLIFLKFYKLKRKKEILLYISSVVIYFLGGFIISNFYKGDSQSIPLIILLISIPILLSIFWTYILESINQEI